MNLDNGRVAQTTAWIVPTSDTKTTENGPRPDIFEPVPKLLSKGKIYETTNKDAVFTTVTGSKMDAAVMGLVVQKFLHGSPEKKGKPNKPDKAADWTQDIAPFLDATQEQRSPPPYERDLLSPFTAEYEGVFSPSCMSLENVSIVSTPPDKFWPFGPIHPYIRGNCSPFSAATSCRWSEGQVQALMEESLIHTPEQMSRSFLFSPLTSVERLGEDKPRASNIYPASPVDHCRWSEGQVQAAMEESLIHTPEQMSRSFLFSPLTSVERLGEDKQRASNIYPASPVEPLMVDETSNDLDMGVLCQKLMELTAKECPLTPKNMDYSVLGGSIDMVSLSETMGHPVRRSMSFEKENVEPNLLENDDETIVLLNSAKKKSL